MIKGKVKKKRVNKIWRSLIKEQSGALFGSSEGPCSQLAA